MQYVVDVVEFDRVDENMKPSRPDKDAVSQCHFDFWDTHPAHGSEKNWFYLKDSQVFIGPESNHWNACQKLTHWLTNSLRNV